MYRILIVDDEPLMRDSLARIMGKISGVTVAAVLKDGTQAKKYLEDHWVDAVFTDIRMPVMDGLELAKYLSASRPECQVVLISAYTEFHYAQQAISFGVKNYLMKPVTFADVKAVVDQLLKDQLEKERRLLWNHNLKQEIMELEIYHALVDGTNGVEKEHYFSKLAVHLDLHGTENDGTIELQQIAWTNIFRWCAPRCIPIFVEQNGQTLNYILLAETMEQLPDPQEIVEHVRGLMDIPFRIQVLQCAEVKELIDNRPSTIEQDKVEDDIIAKARKFISEHLSENISRADVADAVHLDSSYFSKYFKKKCGMTFREYLQDERIKRAKEMIEAGYKIKDVAEKCGFSNRNYFNEIFKKSTGQTASEYKRGQLR